MTPVDHGVTPASASNASAMRCSCVSPPWPPSVSARSGWSRRHCASTNAATMFFKVAPSTGGSRPFRPTIPDGPAKNRSALSARWRFATSSLPSESMRNCSTSRAKSSGDREEAESSRAAAPGLLITGASAATCSADTAPEPNSSSAPAMASTTAATSRRRRASRLDIPHFRARFATESRFCGMAARSNADAASASRRTRSSSRNPASRCLTAHPCG